MAELFEAIASWPTILGALLTFGFLPGFVLRLIVRIYPKSDTRRSELVAELYALRRLERPLYVAEQLETVLFEGVPHRIRQIYIRRRIRRQLKQALQAPVSFGVSGDGKPVIAKTQKYGDWLCVFTNQHDWMAYQQVAQRGRLPSFDRFRTMALGDLVDLLNSRSRKIGILINPFAHPGNKLAILGQTG